MSNFAQFRDQFLGNGNDNNRQPFNEVRANNRAYSNNVNQQQPYPGGLQPGLPQLSLMNNQQQAQRNMFGNMMNENKQQQQLASMNPKDLKKLQREERIRKEKEELQQMESYNPFGRGGAGAPFKDQEGNLISQRGRPFSVIRESQQPYSQPPQQQQQAQYGQYQQQQQQQLQIQQQFRGNEALQPRFAPNVGAKSPQNVPQKITSLETNDQRDLRQKRQLEYQDILREQMEAKKAKEQEQKRKWMEQDMREEQRFKEEVEREKQLEAEEKLKKQQSQRESQNGKGAPAGKVVHTPPRARREPLKQYEQPPEQPQRQSYQQQSPQPRPSPQKIQEPLRRNLPQMQSYQHMPRSNDFDEQSSFSSQNHQRVPPTYKPEFRRHLDIHPANQPMNLNQGLTAQEAPWLVGGPIINQIEKQFDQELFKLKNEMRSQQKEFENQLKTLREEAQRNIEFRYRAEEDLHRGRIDSQRNILRPHMMDLSKAITQEQTNRRSMMMNHVGYEKLFFGPPSINNNSSVPHSTRGVGSNQGTLDYQNLAQSRGGYRSNGVQAAVVMPINFEGSTSLKAESVFVSVSHNNDLKNFQQPRQSQTLIPMKHSAPILKSASIRNSQVDMRGSSQKQQAVEEQKTFLTSFEPPLHSVSIRQSVNQTIIPEEPKDIRDQEPVNEDPLGLLDLENAINEISQLNLAGIPHLKSLNEKVAEVPKPEMLKQMSSIKPETPIDLFPPMVAKKPSFDPDSYVFTEEQLMQAKIDSTDYKLTEDFLTHARVDDHIETSTTAAHLPDPSKIEKAKKMPAETDTYIKTQKQLEQARVEQQWSQKNDSEVFPNLSPQALKGINITKKIPDYKGSVNQDMSDLLNKFQQATNSKEYQESIKFDKDELKQEFLERRKQLQEPLESVFESSNEFTQTKHQPMPVKLSETAQS